MTGQQTTHTSASRCYYCGHTSTAGSQQCAHCGNILLLKQRYRLLGVLGQGGFGVVLEALDARLNRRCAIKRVYASSLEEQKQIQNEVDILSQHASHLAFIPTIYDTWVEQAHTFIVMEYIAGPTLDQTAQPWTAQPIKELLLTMLPNLARLHAAGIVHRDLKPQNIKHTPQGRSAYMLLDFGIAKRGGVTSVKALSPDFAPPEQAQGLPTDARADIYGLAATAYFLLTGLSPLQARIQANGHLPPPAQFVAGLSPHLERILLHMLEPDPARRPPHARAVLALLGSSTPPQSSAPPVATANDWQAPPTIRATPRHPRIGRPPPAPPRPRSYRTNEADFFSQMDSLAAAFEQNPQAVGKNDLPPPAPAPPLWTWQNETYNWEEWEKWEKRQRLVGQAIASLVLALIIAAVLAPLIQLPFPMLLVLWAIILLISLSGRREDKNGSHDTEE